MEKLTDRRLHSYTKISKTKRSNDEQNLEMGEKTKTSRGRRTRQHTEQKRGRDLKFERKDEALSAKLLLHFIVVKKRSILF